jgi:hypothetical protein
MCSILSDLKCYGSATSSSLEIIFQMQRKTSNEKITKQKKAFQLTKQHFFSSLWTPPIFKPHNFLISYSFQMI